MAGSKLVLARSEFGHHWRIRAYGVEPAAGHKMAQTGGGDRASGAASGALERGAPTTGIDPHPSERGGFNHETDQPGGGGISKSRNNSLPYGVAIGAGGRSFDSQNIQKRCLQVLLSSRAAKRLGAI